MKLLTKKEKATWVKALRSGKFPQTTGTLYRAIHVMDGAPAGYCCLGVLAAVCERAVPDDSEAYLAINILPFETQRALAHLNDTEVPFEVIAGLIDHAL